MIDLVITKKDGKYQASGGPPDAIFTGTGDSSDEAIGSWFRQNREAVDFRVSFIENDHFWSSTIFGRGRTREDLGPNELAALEKLENKENKENK